MARPHNLVHTCAHSHLRHAGVVVLDWNFCLDMSGGPNWAGNECDSPILVDSPDAASALPGTVTTFYKQPMYYYFGHVAAFVAPGATRLGVSSSTASYSRDAASLSSAAFLSPNGEMLVAVVLNRGSRAHEIALRTPNGYVNAHLPPNAIRTFIVKA